MQSDHALELPQGASSKLWFYGIFLPKKKTKKPQKQHLKPVYLEVRFDIKLSRLQFSSEE